MGALREKCLRAVAVAASLAWAGSFAYLLATGGYRAFLARSYWWLMTFGAVVFAAFAAAVALRGLPMAHFRGWAGPLICAGLSLLPLAYLAANPRPLPSSYTLSIRAAGFQRLLQSPGAFGLPSGEGPVDYVEPGARWIPAMMPASGPGGERPAWNTTIADLVYRYPQNVGWDVMVEGMIYRPKGLPAGHIVLYRFAITCCAADAIHVAILVASEDAAKLPADRWVRIRGRMEKTQFRGLDIPLLRAESVEPIPTPDDPYID